jgi:hypothetical protein
LPCWSSEVLVPSCLALTREITVVEGMPPEADHERLLGASGCSPNRHGEPIRQPTTAGRHHIDIVCVGDGQIWSAFGPPLAGQAREIPVPRFALKSNVRNLTDTTIGGLLTCGVVRFSKTTYATKGRHFLIGLVQNPG